MEASDVRALLVQAAGDHFGCGVNVKTTFVGVDSKGARQMLGQGIPICTRLEGLNMPVICAVQGLAWQRHSKSHCDATSSSPLMMRSLHRSNSTSARQPTLAALIFWPSGAVPPAHANLFYRRFL